MTEIIQKKLNDSAAARWTALVLVASMMFFGYMFVDVMSPLQSLIEKERGWSPDVFGTYAAGEYILNVFGFLIVAGVILDKCGIRFTGELSASMMFIGACIKFYAISDAFAGSSFATARLMVDIHARLSQVGILRIHDLRLWMRDGWYNRVQGNRQVVQG